MQHGRAHSFDHSSVSAGDSDGDGAQELWLRQSASERPAINAAAGVIARTHSGIAPQAPITTGSAGGRGGSDSESSAAVPVAVPVTVLPRHWQWCQWPYFVKSGGKPQGAGTLRLL